MISCSYHFKKLWIEDPFSPQHYKKKSANTTNYLLSGSTTSESILYREHTLFMLSTINSYKFDYTLWVSIREYCH